MYGQLTNSMLPNLNKDAAGSPAQNLMDNNTPSWHRASIDTPDKVRAAVHPAPILRYNRLNNHRPDQAPTAV